MRLKLHLLAMASSLAVIAVNAARAEDVVISGVTLIDGTGHAPVKNASILIRDGKIARVGPKGAFPVPAEARTIDGTGKFAIPGLMDANVHLYLDLRVESLARFYGHYDDVIVQAAQTALKHGFTTVFDTLGPRAPLVKARDDINAGRRMGSRIFLGGNILGMDNAAQGIFATGLAAPSATFLRRYEDIFVEGTGSSLLWDTPDMLRVKVRAYIGKNIDFVKYMVSGHAPAELNHLYFSPRQQKVIIEEAHRAGKVVQTHTSTVESLNQAVELGVDLMQHCETTGPVIAPPELVRALAKSQIACTTMPMTQARRATLLSILPESDRAALAAQVTNTRNFLAAGVDILLATDAMLLDREFAEQVKRQMGEIQLEWFVAMREQGMAPMAMLQAATSRIAKAYKVDDRLGTLEKGKIADLLLLRDNPLDDPANYGKIDLVMKDGKVVDTASLPIEKIIE